MIECLGHILSCVDDIESEDVENEEAEKGEEKATDQRIEWPMVYLRRNMDDGNMTECENV